MLRGSFYLRLTQGGQPSPFDRNLGTKMAAKCIERLIQQIQDGKQTDGLMLEILLFLILMIMLSLVVLYCSVHFPAGVFCVFSLYVSV